ncbi:MAG: hypothetical protein JW942_09260 [Opitutales bacterium]|nr:hypothetical protein [Opitutales bacterium]
MCSFFVSTILAGSSLNALTLESVDGLQNKSSDLPDISTVVGDFAVYTDDVPEFGRSLWAMNLTSGEKIRISPDSAYPMGVMARPFDKQGTNLFFRVADIYSFDGRPEIACSSQTGLPLPSPRYPWCPTGS